MKKILLIGNGLVGKDFYTRFKNIYDIFIITKKNKDKIDEMLEFNIFDTLIYTAKSSEYKKPNITNDVINVQINQLKKILDLGIGKIKNVILFSTGTIYQLKNNYHEKIQINSEINLSNPKSYPSSKIMSELLVKSYDDFYSISIIRPFYIYGYFQKKDMLFKSILLKIKNDEEISINKNGGMFFNPIHVKDCSYFLYNLIENKQTKIKEYIICGNEIISLEYVIKQIGKYLNKIPKIKYIDENPIYCIAESNTNLELMVKIDDGLSSMIHDNV